MMKRITALMLLVSTALSAETLPDSHMMRDMSMGESRRALQDSTRGVTTPLSAAETTALAG